MRPRDRSRALLAFALTTFLFLVGCDAWTQVSGTVRDEAGKPIQGATVTLKISGYSQQRTTYEDGRYAISLTHGAWPQGLVFTVSKDGYRPYEKDLKTGRFDDFNVVLKRIK